MIRTVNDSDPTYNLHSDTLLLERLALVRQYVSQSIFIFKTFFQCKTCIAAVRMLSCYSRIIYKFSLFSKHKQIAWKANFQIGANNFKEFQQQVLFDESRSTFNSSIGFGFDNKLFHVQLVLEKLKLNIKQIRQAAQ